MNNITAWLELSEFEVDGLPEEYDDYEIDVGFIVTPYIPATYGHPSEGGDIEIQYATLSDGRDIFDVYKLDIKELREKIMWWIEEMYND
jgi:hypothetical protein